MTDYLEHYGVKGMKWGVRRYQDKSGRLTPEGRRHRYDSATYKYVDKTLDDVQSIVDTMTSKERKLLGGNPNEPYMKTEEIGDVTKRFMKYCGDKPVAFLDVYRASSGAGTIAIGTRSGEEYRGKGNAQSLVNQAKSWLETSPQAKEVLQMDTFNWFARRENEPSINLAKKSGFQDREDYQEDEEWWGGRYKAK